MTLIDDVRAKQKIIISNKNQSNETTTTRPASFGRATSTTQRGTRVGSFSFCRLHLEEESIPANMRNQRSITAIVATLLLQALSTSGFQSIIHSSSTKRTLPTLYSQPQQFNNENDSSSKVELSRRSFNRASAAAALSTLLVSTSSNVLPATAAEYETVKPNQRILITGSNSGIGLDAAQRLALRGHEVILACVSRLIWSYVYVYAVVRMMYSQHLHIIFVYLYYYLRDQLKSN